jgi:hypothetical protein
MNNEFNFLLLVIYFLCVTYVLYQIVNSFNDEFTVKLEKGELDGELQSLKLDDRVEISFKFDGRYEINNDQSKLKQLAITIKNKSDHYPIYVDWDSCSITDWFGDRSRRVTRLVPGSTMDYFQPQVFSAITPGRALQENIAAEDMQSRTGDKGELAIAKTLLDLSKPPVMAPDAKKKGYKAFIDGQKPLFFTLDLIMRFASDHSGPTGYPTRVRCKFRLHRLNWTAGLPWNPKK